MELKEKLVSSFIAFENQISLDNSFIHSMRTESLKHFETQGFPEKKDEAWKYTSLKKVLKEDFSVFSKTEQALEYKDVQPYFIHDIDSYKIVFVDGKYASHLSQTTHDGIDICLMSYALEKPKYRSVIENYFNKIAEQNSLISLNTAFVNEGAYIHITKNKLYNCIEI